VPFPRRARAEAYLARVLPSGRSVAAGLALLALAAGFYALARTTSVFGIERVDVRGAPPAVAAQVRAALAPLEGHSLVALDGASVLRRVEAVPEVASASYDRAFPHTLVVRVEPERPVAVLRRGAASWLLSARGRVLRKMPTGSRAALPRIWLSKEVEVAAGALPASREAVRAARALGWLALSGLGVRVRTVRAGREELTFVLVSGLELRLGDERDLALKLAVAGRVLPLLPHPAPPERTYLDVSVPERPVAGPTLNSKVQLES
jgi:cell division protein FtsQ